MAFSLFPRDEDFFALFRKQAALVRQGCDDLLAITTHFNEREERARKLKDLESEGDSVTHDILERLNRTFITPLERDDIHDLASGMDDVLDAVEALASRLVLFNVTEIRPPAVQLIGLVARSGQQIEAAIGHLKDLRDPKPLFAFTIEINRLENEADHISREAVADLFSGQHDLLDVMRWKEIYGRLEGAADRCEDVANTIEAIVLKSR